MPTVKKLYAEKRQVSTGDMRFLVDIFTAAITAPNMANAVDYSLTKTLLQTVWASVKTLPNVTVFDSMNIEQTVSHEFIIRYIAGIDKDTYLRYPSVTGEYYRIVYTEDLDKRQEFLLLKCTLKGQENN